MKTEYITKYVNEYGQINVYGVLKSISEKCNFKLWYVAEKWINELYEIYTGTEYENINNDMFVMSTDDENEMFLLMGKISRNVMGGKISW